MLFIFYCRFCKPLLQYVHTDLDLLLWSSFLLPDCKFQRPLSFSVSSILYRTLLIPTAKTYLSSLELKRKTNDLLDHLFVMERDTNFKSATGKANRWQIQGPFGSQCNWQASIALWGKSYQITTSSLSKGLVRLCSFPLSHEWVPREGATNEVWLWGGLNSTARERLHSFACTDSSS